MAAQLYQLAATGYVTAQLIADSMNVTVIRQTSLGVGIGAPPWALPSTMTFLGALVVLPLAGIAGAGQAGLMEFWIGVLVLGVGWRWR